MFIKAIVFLAAAAATLSAQAETKEDIIRDAVKNGAIVVICQSGKCRNVATGEMIGSGSDGGPFLVFPNDPRSKEVEKRTVQRLALLSKL